MKLDQPTWLLLLVLPPLLALVAWLVSRARQRLWAAFAADRLRSTLIKGDSPLPRWFSFASLLAAILLLIVALARPYATSGTSTERIRGRNVLFALDVSRSMRVSDVKPDRLAQSKIIAYELMESMPSERIGLLAFAGEAYLCAPLTTDHRAVRETIEQLDESWVTLGGSDLTRAIQLAITTFRATGQRHNALVILSDGEEHDAQRDDAILAARQAGLCVITIGIGTEDGGYVPHPDTPGRPMTDRSGKPVLSRLQSEGLRKLATETGGTFALAAAGTDLTSLVRTAVHQLEAFEIEGRQRAIRAEFYPWIALPAAVLLAFSLMAGTRWRRLTPLAILSAFALFPSHDAQAASAADARDALTAGEHEKAAALYQQLSESTTTARRRSGFRLGEALAAYRAGDYRRARAAFSAALLSPDPALTREAHLGMANTLFQSGWHLLAARPHPTAPDPAPTMDAFDTLARSLLAGENPASEESDADATSRRIRFIIRDWTDAIRHYDTLLADTPAHREAIPNRALSLRYLRRLAELLKEEEEKTQQSLPEPPPEGAPNPESEPESEPGEQPSDEPNGNQPDPDPRAKNPSRDPQDQRGKDDSSPSSPPRTEPPRAAKPPPADPSKRQPPLQGESPEERARRLLLENADTERGPLTPGRIEFRTPEKDW